MLNRRAVIGVGEDVAEDALRQTTFDGDCGFAAEGTVCSAASIESSSQLRGQLF